MKLSQLHFFCAVIEKETIAAAAITMHCVPSNITMRIQELECQFRVKLFFREKNRLIATPEGRLLYRKAKEILKMAKATEQIFCNSSKTSLLNVGAIDIALNYNLPTRIADYLHRVPDVELNLYCEQSVVLEKKLLAGALDLIISDGPIEHPLLTKTLAFREYLKIITPWEVCQPSDSQLAKYDFYVFGDSYYYQHHINHWLESSGISPRSVIKIESYPVIFSCVVKGIGYACVPESLITGTPLFQVQSFYLSEPNNVYFIWRTNLKSPVVTEFIKILSETAT